jgi:hypothetical protein
MTVPDPATLATLAIAFVTTILVLVTGGLVVATLGLVAATFWQAHLTRKSHDLSIRPLLADPNPGVGGVLDDILFGAPGGTHCKRLLEPFGCALTAPRFPFPFGMWARVLR